MRWTGPNRADERDRRGQSQDRLPLWFVVAVGGHHEAPAERPSPSFWLAGLRGDRRAGRAFRRACHGKARQAPDSAKRQIVRAPGAKTSVVTTGSGAYYIEFRSRYAWDYGHTYVVHGRVGEAPTHDSVAGLSPVGDDATAWVIGHYVPVPAETGWTDGDLEDKYVTSRYRVLMGKDQYDRVRGPYQGAAGPVAYVERGTL